MDTIVYQDFIGFSFNNVHSSELGIIRTSDGSRFNESLLPSFQDKTVQIPNGNGSYYFNTYYTNRQFTINFAFDSITETQKRKLVQFFGSGSIGELVFDETPYKAYDVKVANNPIFKFICFDTSNKERVYKGEGSINLVAYQPFAHNPKGKFYLSDYVNAGYLIHQWASAADLIDAETNIYYNNWRNGSDYKYIYTHNAGDIDTPFTLDFTMDTALSSSTSITLQSATEEQLKFILPASFKSNFRINTQTHLIEEINNDGNTTGKIFNQYITSGDFFYLPTGDDVVKLISSNINFGKLKYNYYYL